MVCCVHSIKQDSLNQGLVSAIESVVCCVQYKARFTQSGLVSAIEQ